MHLTDICMALLSYVRFLQKIKCFTYHLHIILTPYFGKSYKLALIADLRLQPVCRIAFDQAVLKIDCFYLDETIQKRFWFSLQDRLIGALHHTATFTG